MLPSLLSSSVPPLPFFLIFFVPPLPFPLRLLRRLSKTLKQCFWKSPNIEKEMINTTSFTLFMCYGFFCIICMIFVTSLELLQSFGIFVLQNMEVDIYMDILKLAMFWLKNRGSTYTQVRLIHRKIQYRIYPCIMHTFFSQILPLKSRCALYTEPFVFLLGNLRNNTKSAKSNKSQFYATSRNKSRQKVCLALYITSVHVHHGISHAACLRS